MNSIKTVFILAVLGVVAYGVYVSINNNQHTVPPPGADQGWPSPPTIEIPQVGTTAPPFTPGSPGMVQVEGGAATWGGQGATSAGQLTGGITAPPFSGGTVSASQPDSLPPPFPPEGYPSADNQFPPLPGPVPASPVPSTETLHAAPGLGGTADVNRGAAFDSFMQTVQKHLDAGGLAEALEILSQAYGDPTLSDQQNHRLVDLLDQVAGTVIYSRHHLLEQPYMVRVGEKLDEIAHAYQVPPQLLAKINGIRDPNNLRPGQELKVIRGPFSAVIDADKCELTLMLQGRYAGRFKIGVGHQLQQLPGTYVVNVKNSAPLSHIQGTRWLGLASEDDRPVGPDFGIHGTNNAMDIESLMATGTICLGDRDLEDVYDILSVGSRVVVRR